MSTAFGRDTSRQRKLGGLLQQIRKQAGLSGETLAGRLGISQSQLSRVERGEAPTKEDTLDLVSRWTRECHADPADRDRAAELAQAATIQFATWQEAVASGLAALQREAMIAEAAATTISAWVPSLIPGLLQTADYAHALVAGDYPDRDDIAEAVAMRMQRQAVLFDHRKTLRWVIGEAGLRWRVAPPHVMAAQLDRLIHLSTEDRLDVRVLPFEQTEPIWHDHTFTVLAGRENGDPDLVHLELLTGPANVIKAEEVARYVSAYEALAELALRGADAVPLLRQVRDEFAAGA